MNKLEKMVIKAFNFLQGRRLVIEDERALGDSTNAVRGHTIFDLSSLRDYMLDNRLHTGFKARTNVTRGYSVGGWDSEDSRLYGLSGYDATRWVLNCGSRDHPVGKINLYVFEGPSRSKVYIDFENTYEQTGGKFFTNRGHIKFEIKNKYRNCGVFHPNGWNQTIPQPAKTDL